MCKLYPSKSLGKCFIPFFPFSLLPFYLALMQLHNLLPASMSPPQCILENSAFVLLEVFIVHTPAPHAFKPPVCQRCSPSETQIPLGCFPRFLPIWLWLELNWKTGVAVLTLNPGKSFASLNLSFLCHEVSITIPGPQQRHCGPNLHVQSTRRPSHIKHALGLDDVTPVIFLYSISQNIFFCLFQKYIISILASTALLTLIPPNGFMFLSFFSFNFSWVFPLKSK